ncbi:hypothetical protein [Paenibacillus brasilensis]|uniref:Molecular chaperone DnaJ n=1 Tax=Paenibacillus brasilensis TaxID=128574 RepID=A0ABU0KZ10_9BACL|nr:hypothetical protein [Paenibacillus brasilensis]MDQ0494674.1 hypothetical protein [Paenibacillus brasilensis]
MDNMKNTQFEKRIKILLEWKSRLLQLAEDELSPFDKWCAENELSAADQHFLTNLCMLFSMRLHPDQNNPDVRKITKNFEEHFKVTDFELSYEEFEKFIKDYQLKEHPIHVWDAREVLEKLAESNRSIELKQKLLG